MSVVERITTTDRDQGTTDDENETSLFLHAFEIDKILGAGSFGVVYKVSKKTFGDPLDIFEFFDDSTSKTAEPALKKTFAIKIIPNGRITEARFSAELCHPNIVSCYNVWGEDGRSPKFQGLQDVRKMLDEKEKLVTSSCTDNGCGPWTPEPTGFLIPPFLLIQFEYCSENDLDKYLLETRIFPPDQNLADRYYAETQNFFSQLLEALLFMELKNVVHGDLKPNNIFLTRRQPDGPITLKIGDFGLSSPRMGFAASETLTSLKNGQTPDNDEIRAEAMQRLYQSPEQARKSAFKRYKTVAGGSHKSDIYSLGLIFIPMLIQFKCLDDRNSALFDATFQEFNENKYLRELKTRFGSNEFMWIEKMLNHDIQARPSASEIKDWVLKVPGYQIQYGPSTPKSQLQNMLEMFEMFMDKDMEDIDGAFKGFKRRSYTYLKELIHEALVSLPDKDDEIIMKALNYLDNNPEGSLIDVHYFHTVLVPLLEESKGLEDPVTLKWLYNLAFGQAISKNEVKTKKGMANLERIRGTETYRNLPPTDSLKLAVECGMFSLRYNEYGDEVEEKSEISCNPEELEGALEEVRAIYKTLTEELEMSPLENINASSMFLVQAKLLVKLGRIEEAEELFQPIIAQVEADFETIRSNPEVTEFSSKKSSILMNYYKFLPFCNRRDEAIQKMGNLCKYYLHIKDVAETTSTFEDLLGLYGDCWEDVKDCELLKPVMRLLFTTGDISKVKNVLVDPSQFTLDVEQNFKVTAYDFNIIDKTTLLD